MTRSPVRTAAAVLVVFVLGLVLAGCVPDRPGNAAGWLSDQPGIVSAEVIADHSGEFQSSGISRGELAPDLSDSQFASLVTSASHYIDTHDEVSIRLGRDGIDFVVSPDEASTAVAIDLWKSLATIPKIASALTRGDNSVHVRTLRGDAVGVLADLEPLGTDVLIEALNDQAAVDEDVKQDAFFDDSIFNIDSLGLEWPLGCTPTDPERALAESFFDRLEIGGGVLTYCSAFDLYFTRDASLATLLPALYSEAADADLLDFPVTAHQIVASAPDGHLVNVTPGDPAVLAVLAAFEVPGAPALYYTLRTDRSLDVVEYATPTADLLALVSASPTAATLPLIHIEGDTSSIDGTLADLPAMLEQVTALVATSDIFTNVELGPTTGFLDLNSPVATDPDVVVAATALRASGAWVGRAFTVGYIGMTLTITDGVAVIDNPSYTDPHVLDAFAAAWNGSNG